MSPLIDLDLIRNLKDMGGIVLKRAVSYKGFIINDSYLDTENSLISFCANYAFDNSKDSEKRRIALELSTKILNNNYSK